MCAAELGVLVMWVLSKNWICPQAPTKTSGRGREAVPGAELGGIVQHVCGGTDHFSTRLVFGLYVYFTHIVDIVMDFP